VHAFAEIRGDRSHRVWRYHPTTDRLDTGGERYRGTATDDQSLACLHRCEKGGYWEDELDRLRNALALANLPKIAAATTMRQLIDQRDTEEGDFRYPGDLTAIWEWADISLDDFLHDPDQNPVAVADAVEANIGTALEVLHGIGIVHLDVAPNNILRVAGSWKLADLDSCTERGSPAVRQPPDERFVHPDRRDGPALARDEFDLYGLEQTLIALRSAQP
jgi:hypothetical protein